MDAEFAARLKEVNKRAAEVARDIKTTDDVTMLQVLIAQYGNECYEIGVSDGRKKAKEEA